MMSLYIGGCDAVHGMAGGAHLYSVCVSEELVLQTSEELPARKASIGSP